MFFLEAASPQIHSIFSAISAGDAVTITSGVLGSFWLSTGPRSAVRVKRLR